MNYGEAIQTVRKEQVKSYFANNVFRFEQIWMAEPEIRLMIFLRLVRWSHAYVKSDKPIDVANMFSYMCWQSINLVVFSLLKEEKISLEKM